ncbi:hypothetical protein S40285_08760 [Stachybotrys chlorohalonatus IBT 40285]|uniref:Uncharacterized protein n=1 Tax=Stachybotrys chlorohalonatus (strain IBT 40285) TaxID=1283841 RepID=A0A084Q7T2_STAC4|nr:hypothetical protein S40285_08760 [Stachybotrys chlorohalonata IBT 40285]
MADMPRKEYLKAHGIDGTGTLQFGIEIEFCIPPTEYPIAQEHPAYANADLAHLDAQRIVTLTWLLEPDLLFSLCPEARQVNPPLAKNARFVVEAPQHPADPAKSHPEMLEDVPIPMMWARKKALTRIYDAADLFELSEIVKGRNLAHPGMDECFENLGPSSFSQKFIREWVALVLNVTKIALLTPTEYKKVLPPIWELVSEPEAQGGWVCLFTMIKGRLQFEWDINMDERYWLQRMRELSTF